MRWEGSEWPGRIIVGEESGLWDNARRVITGDREMQRRVMSAGHWNVRRMEERASVIGSYYQLAEDMVASEDEKSKMLTGV